MAVLTIRNLDEAVKKKLRINAAMHGCSMEEEARRILRAALIQKDNQKGIGSRIHKRFAEIGDVDLVIPARSMPRPTPDFTGENQ